MTQLDIITMTTIMSAMILRNTALLNGFKTIQMIILEEISKPLARTLAAVLHLHTATKSYAMVRNEQYFILPLFGVCY